MTASLRTVLEATGYMEGGQAAPGVYFDIETSASRRGRLFRPDALWRGPASLTVYFKYEKTPPELDKVTAWRHEIWNEGFAPLLWVISPSRIEVYNGFGRPLADNDAITHRLRTFEAIDSKLQELDAWAGRLTMETGKFWEHSDAVSRKTSVDQQLLSDLADLERDLIKSNLDRDAAQGLIARSIFTQYLIDRRIIDGDQLLQHCRVRTLPTAFRTARAVAELFRWLGEVFNGDMFPASMSLDHVTGNHLSRVADFLEAVDPKTGQRSLFPYRFDIIPVELISAIYEQFVHTRAMSETIHLGDPAEPTVDNKQSGVHYTRLPVVSLVLDEVMDGLSGNETILDLTCGSGVFLVEALRRLVVLKSHNDPSREIIRSTLHNQICGVDISEAAIRVAAFSLYLAALELDPDPQPPEALKFAPLIGRTLLVGDARSIEETSGGASLRMPSGDTRRFDVIVGNPPWTFKGKSGTKKRRATSKPLGPMQPRGEGLDFVLRALDFGHDRTRYGIVLSALPFFAGSKTGAAAAAEILQRLSPATLVNLAAMTNWLFPTAKMPAVVLLARCRSQPADQLTVVNVPWSRAAERSHTFSISPSDIKVLSLSNFNQDPSRLKTAVYGRNRDMLLINELRSECGVLKSWLHSIGSDWRDGLIFGAENQRIRDASHLLGLKILGTKDLERFQVPDDLCLFDKQRVQWPRTRETYCAPLLLIKEFLRGDPRPIAAVADQDLIYTDAYFGAVLGEPHRQGGKLVAAVLNSSLAAWFILMTAAEFGIFKRRLLITDVDDLPIPNPDEAVRSEAGRRLLALETRFHNGGISEEDWASLDNAVFDLYGLDKLDRLIVSDGLVRAQWQWKSGRNSSADAARLADLHSYANAFLSVIAGWLQSISKRGMCAEVFDFPATAPLRVIRFILTDKIISSVVNIEPQADLATTLGQIGDRLRMPIASSLIGVRELRVHGVNEVVIIKPSARRFWLSVAALDDADAVVAESFTRIQQ